MLSGARKTLTYICIFILVLVLVPSFFIPAAEFILFQPEPYQKELAKQNIYSRMPAWLAEITVTSASPAEKNALSFLGKEGLQRLYAQVFSPDWVKPQVDSVINQLWDYLNFNTKELTLKVDLSHLKASLAGEGPSSVAGQVLRSWPACSMDELVILSGVLDRGLSSGSIPGDLPLCSPPETLMPTADQFMQTAFVSFANTIPSQVDLVDYFKSSSNYEQQMADWVKIYAGYEAVRWSGRVLPVLSLIMLGLAAGLSAVSWRSTFTYTGFPLTLAGILGFVSAGLLWFLSAQITSKLVSAMVSVPDEMFRAFLLALQQVFTSFLVWPAILAIIVAGVGLVLVVVPSRR